MISLAEMNFVSSRTVQVSTHKHSIKENKIVRAKKEQFYRAYCVWLYFLENANNKLFTLIYYAHFLFSIPQLYSFCLSHHFGVPTYRTAQFSVYNDRVGRYKMSLGLSYIYGSLLDKQQRCEWYHNRNLFESKCTFFEWKL